MVTKKSIPTYYETIDGGHKRTFVTYSPRLKEYPHPEETWSSKNRYKDGYPMVIVKKHTAAKKKTIHDYDKKEWLPYLADRDYNPLSNLSGKTIKGKDIDKLRTYTVTIPDKVYDRRQKHEDENIRKKYGIAVPTSIKQFTEHRNMEKVLRKLARHHRVTKGKKSHRS
jgi:hypothetical protein